MVCIVAAGSLVAVPAPAIDYTWTSATTGGLWSDTSAWTPNAASGGPTAGDAVVLDTTANSTARTVTIDSSAWGGVT